MSPVVVVGSLNMDLVVRCVRLPRPGQTVAGGDLADVPGGKGANQAVAAVRLAGDRPVRMVGRVGDDAFGRRLCHGLATAGIDAAHVRFTPGVPSGRALIAVGDRGENTIIVSPGANGRLTPADVPEDVLSTAAVVLLQLEVPVGVVVNVARRAGRATVVLDPAPVPPSGLGDEVLSAIDLTTPNQTEAEALTGIRVSTVDGATRAAAALAARGCRRVVVKLGPDGCVVGDATGVRHMPGFAVSVVDTTAAGDAFNGALAVALAEGHDLPSAARFANAAGALACTAVGAQTSAPTRAAVDAMLCRVPAGG